MSPAHGDDTNSTEARPATENSWNFLPVGLAILVAVQVVVVANVFFMRPSAALLQAPDEAYAIAFARRMLEGRFLPYVDAVSHRGPLFYAFTALGVKVFGYGTWMPARALALGSVLTTILVGSWAAARAGRPVTGAVMALVYAGVLCIGMPLEDGLGYNSEQPLAMFAMASLACLVLSLDAKTTQRAAWAALSGVTLSACGLCKQTGFVLLLPFGAWVLCAAAAAPELIERDRKRVPLAFALGVLGPLVALVVRYAVAGELGTLYYYQFTYNSDVYLRAFLSFRPLRDAADALGTHFYEATALAPLVGWTIVSPFRSARALRDVPRIYAENGFEVTVGIAALLSPFAADSSLRNLPHYYVLVVPWAGFLLGLAVDRGLRSVPPGKFMFIARVAVLLPLTLVMAFAMQRRWQWFEREPEIKWRFSTHDEPICRFLHEHTKADDSVFIWGFWAVPYTACNRRPASRYVYATFVSGYVPFVNDDPANDAARIVPGSLGILRDELTRDPPAAIIDAPLTLGSRFLVRNEFLKGFVMNGYCEQTDDLGQPGARAWIRRGRPGCPAQ